MSFSKEWEQLYQNNKQLSIWPWSDLVSYLMRYARPKNGIKILEVGFGAGANIPFYKKIQSDFYGIEGSETMVKVVKEQYPEYADKLVCGDFTEEIPFDETFDVIIDRSSLTLNPTSSIINSLGLIYDKLNNNGFFIGIDWFSTMHSEFERNGKMIDENSKVFTEGYWKNTGTVHFSDENHLRELLSNFKIHKLEHKLHYDSTKEDERLENDTQIKVLASWNFVAKKENDNDNG